MIDVLKEVKQFLIFESEDDFYYLQIIQRKKENPELGSNSRVIKNYYIGSIEYLESKYEEIKELCNQFNARAMLRLNKRSYRKVAYKTMQNIANSMANGEYSFIKKSYDRACGAGHNDSNKKWILDIDNEVGKPFSTATMWGLIKFLTYDTLPEGDKIYKTLPTKNGAHLITKPFDLKEFRQKYPDIDVHKDNPINLYIP